MPILKLLVFIYVALYALVLIIFLTFNPFLVEYFDDKKSPDQYVRVNVDIKGLKKKLLGGPANADISFDVTDR